MSMLMILIPVTLFMGLVGLAAFFWSLRAKQYEDLTGDAERILFDSADQPLKPQHPQSSRASERPVDTPLKETQP